MKPKKEQVLKVLKPDGTVLEQTVKGFESFHTLQTLVGGMVTYISLPKSQVLVVNEEGLLLGLPPNRNASEAVGQFIVGTAVLCHKSALT